MMIVVAGSINLLAIHMVSPVLAAGRHPQSDFNADGYNDLVIGAWHESIGAATNAGAVNVIYGSAGGLSTTIVPDQFWNQGSPGIDDFPESGDAFGSAVAPGDFNNDGYSDLAIGVRFESVDGMTKAGAVNAIYGSSAGLRATAAGDGSGRTDQVWRQNTLGVENNAEAGDIFGWSLIGLDFNGDGYAELGIGAPREDIREISDAGAVNVLYGTSSGLSATALPDQFWTQNSPSVEDFAETGDQFGIGKEG